MSTRKQNIAALTLVVKNYDEAIHFYVETMGFTLVEDTRLGADKRWVLVSPPGDSVCSLLLAKAVGDEQLKAVGNQTGGRVFLFLNTNNFDRDYNAMLSRGVSFLEKPRHEPYGTVAVFEDLYGNKWDLLERS